jgi:large subunit ribosomal protein L13
VISKSTHYAKQGEVQRNWVLVDADGAVLGRLATQIAMILRGKNKPQFTPNSDCGDFVVVINADKVQLTGNKADTKTYYRHSGYNGGYGEAPGEGHRARRSRYAAQDYPRPCPDDQA